MRLGGDCFDKMLRMFGTFHPELPDIDIVYGLVDQPQFFNAIKHQVRIFVQVTVLSYCHLSLPPIIIGGHLVNGAKCGATLNRQQAF